MKWNNSLYPLIIVFTIIFSNFLLLLCKKKVLRESKFCLFLIFFFNATYFILNCERSEPGSHFISRWNMTVQVNVVLNRTVVDSD